MLTLALTSRSVKIAGRCAASSRNVRIDRRVKPTLFCLDNHPCIDDAIQHDDETAQKALDHKRQASRIDKWQKVTRDEINLVGGVARKFQKV